MYDSIVEEHVKTRKAKIWKACLPWVDGQMRKLMNKRYKLLKQCDGTEKTSAQWTEYRKVKNKVTKMMRQAEAKYWHDQFTPCIMCVQYRGGCSVLWGCSVPWGDIMSTVGGYHEYRGGIS